MKIARFERIAAQAPLSPSQARSQLLDMERQLVNTQTGRIQSG